MNLHEKNERPRKFRTLFWRHIVGLPEVSTSKFWTRQRTLHILIEWKEYKVSEKYLRIRDQDTWEHLIQK